MEEVKKSLKAYFEKNKDYSDVIPKSDPDYLRKIYEIEIYKVSFAIGYMKDNDKINKKDALQIVSDILQERF